MENDQSLSVCLDFVRETKPGREPENAGSSLAVNVEQNITS
jgi:hypothetical protein